MKIILYQRILIFPYRSHHANSTIFLLSQNLFHGAKGFRDISLNSHYLVLFRNKRDTQQICTLAKQMGKRFNHLLEAYEDATKSAHSYLFLDLKNSTPDYLTIRSNILPSEQPQILYIKSDNGGCP